MSDIIIVIIVLAVLALAVRSAVKHFRGEGGCCGGGDYKARKKKLGSVCGKKSFRVEGMMCQNCINRVMESVNSIPGASAVVALKKGIVTVEMENPIEDAAIIEAIEKAGYEVKGSV